MVTVQHRNIGTPDEDYTLLSGYVQHGKQYVDPAKRREPITYYGPDSGMGIAIEFAQARSKTVRIGVIGLGVGAIATYARPGDVIRFYEINPEMVAVAQNTNYFHYLSDCEGKTEVVLGDARLQLEHEAAAGNKGKTEVVLGDARLQLEHEAAAGNKQQFDILVLDAFSGDAVPTHLLTREAVEIYKQHLAPDGILAFHITNTYLDLYPVVKQLAEHHELGHRRIYSKGDYDRTLYRSYCVLASSDSKFLADVQDDIRNLPDYLKKVRKIPIWTDNYTNLMRLLR
jgi:spermidine synthase